MICAHTEGVDSCQGDSGGPMTVINPDTNRVELIGIVSFGFGCGTNPGVYAKVSQKLDFIQYIVNAAGLNGGCIPT